MPPVDPGPCTWVLPDPTIAIDEPLLGVGADLAPSTLIEAYRRGLFPMPVRRRTLGWYSPDPRAVIPLDGLRVSRSLRRSVDRYRITVDETFGEVVHACADPKRPHGWISHDIERAYARLHHLGWAHSVEARLDDGSLVGGLYGVAVGGLFAGESMFHKATDASKVALVALVDRLVAGGYRLLDVQWQTPHLETLGAIEIPRRDYLAALADAVAVTATF